MQAITGLNETISLVLDFLQDAKVFLPTKYDRYYFKIIYPEDENLTGPWATER